MKIEYTGSANTVNGVAHIEGLYVGKDGDVEPLLVIRASEEAASAALLEYMRAAQARNYTPQMMNSLQSLARSIELWRMKNGGTQRREPDMVIHGRTYLPNTPTPRPLDLAPPIPPMPVPLPAAPQGRPSVMPLERPRLGRPPKLRP